MQGEVNLRVLLVDDDSDLRELFTEALRERGYYAVAVGSAEEALERLNPLRGLSSFNGLSNDAGVAPCKFDIVACDMVMPGMDGIELMKRIRRSCPEVLLIMITGDGAIETASKAIEAGAFGYMTKPFRFDEFLIIMKNAAERLALMSENSRLRSELRMAHAGMAELKKQSSFNAAGPAAKIPSKESPRKRKKAGAV